MNEHETKHQTSAGDQPLVGASPVQAVARFWRRYATFTGRASGSEFWWWFLVNAVVTVILVVTTRLVDADLAGAAWQGFWAGAVTEGAPGSVQSAALGTWGLITLIPGLALAARRLHDIDRSGWWQVIAVVPIVGTIWFLILCASASDPRGARFDGDRVRTASPSTAPDTAPQSATATTTAQLGQDDRSR